MNRKLHLILILEDNEVICKTEALHPHESVAEALQAVATDPEVVPHLPYIVKGIRILDGNVFMDDKEKTLYLLGQLPGIPTDAHTLRVTDEVMAAAH